MHYDLKLKLKIGKRFRKKYVTFCVVSVVVGRQSHHASLTKAKRVLLKGKD